MHVCVRLPVESRVAALRALRLTVRLTSRPIVIVLHFSLQEWCEKVIGRRGESMDEELKEAFTWGGEDG